MQWVFLAAPYTTGWRWQSSCDGN